LEIPRSKIERQAVGQLRGEYPYYYIIPLREDAILS
jgi:hypothetical protein